MILPNPVVYSKYISEVLDYMPAQGSLPMICQNIMPEKLKRYDPKANNAIAKGANGMISLGGFGGMLPSDSIILYKMVKAPILKFWAILSQEAQNPGLLWLHLDKNKNGKPDDDEWYEIAGSEYFKDSTIKNYSITYYKPK